MLGYLPTNFGLPSTFGSRVIHYTCTRQTDRQTDRRTDGQKQSILAAPFPTGGGIMSEYGEAIAMLSGQVKALQTRGPPVVSSVTMAPVSLQPLQPSDPLCESRLASSVDFPTLAQAQSADSVTDQPSSKSDWASIAVSSTPIAHTNRFAALQSADDEEQSDGSH